MHSCFEGGRSLYARTIMMPSDAGRRICSDGRFARATDSLFGDGRGRAPSTTAPDRDAALGRYDGKLTDRFGGKWMSNCRSLERR